MTLIQGGPLPVVGGVKTRISRVISLVTHLYIRPFIGGVFHPTYSHRLGVHLAHPNSLGNLKISILEARNANH